MVNKSLRFCWLGGSSCGVQFNSFCGNFEPVDFEKDKKMRQSLDLP